MLFLFGDQAMAGTFQTCSETAGNNTQIESQKMERDCHESGDDETYNPEICDVQHCCMGATSSVMYPLPQSMADMNKPRVNYLSYTCIRSCLNDIYHPPKFLL